MNKETIKNIILTIIVIGVGITLFTEIPTKVKIEASKMAFSQPSIFIFMFICLVTSIFLFWAMIYIQIPQVFGGEQGRIDAERNLKKLDKLINKLRFGKIFSKLKSFNINI
jgi:hypothetical protein